jgi:O-antigen ligase
LKLPIGRYWVLFTCILVATVPFSTWPSASLGQLGSYIPRGILCYFAIAAFVVDVAAVKWFFFTEIVKGLLLLLNCVLWGGPTDDARFVLKGSSFYANSNELALALTAIIAFFIYLTFQKSAVKVLLGAAGFLGDIYFLLKTGSRGGFLAFAAIIVFSLLFSAGHRIRILSMVLLLPVLIVFVPADTLQRLTYIFADPATATIRTDTDTAALMSQIQRTQLFWKSVHMTIEHPILGVGVGEFPDAVYQNDVVNHTRSAALGTHNSYTQVGAECGIPALLVYLLILVTAIRMNYRIYKRTQTDPRMSFFPTAALCLLTATVGFAVGSAFHHVAWTGVIPSLTGITAGLWQACQKEADKAGIPELLTRLDA